MRLTLVPSYGRDYRSGKEVKADFEAGKDFTICDMSSPDDGRKANKPCFKRGDVLVIRYKRLTQMVVVTVK